MKNLHKIIYIAVGALSLSALMQANAQVITEWSFSSAAPAGTNSPAPTIGSGTATSLGMTNTYSYAGTTATNSVTSDDVLSTTGTANTSFTEDTWRIRGTYVATGTAPNVGSPSKSANVNGWNLAAPEYSQGAQFNVSTAGYSNIQVSFDWYSTTQGVRDLQFQYNLNTANSTGWTNFGGTSPTGTYIATSNDFYGATSSIGVVPITLNLSSISGANGDASFGIRLVSAYDSTGTLGATYASASSTPGSIVAYNNNSGNWRFDNITVSGTVAAPEPSTYALMLGGFAMLVAIHQLRRRNSAV